ncbi:MAG: hypothetical protein R3B70_25730 [Polyangiaceae bacterium]
MNRSLMLCLAATAFPVAVAVATPQAAGAQELIWRGTEATARGSGCPPGTVRYLINGNNLSLFFSTLGLAMPVGFGPSFQESSCEVTFPVTVRSGARISQFVRGLSYGVFKTPGASSTIRTADTFFTVPVDTFSSTLPFGFFFQGIASEAQTSPFPFIGACSGSVTGIYVARLSVTGERLSRNQALFLGDGSPDLMVRYDIVPTVGACPLPTGGDDDGGGGGEGGDGGGGGGEGGGGGGDCDWLP